jgi:type IV fimbrial biogenesis protein FimT
MRANSGFSLIELMITITVVAILMALGVPSFRYITNSNRVSAEVNALLGDMQFARSEAIKEGLPVTVCPALDATLTGCAQNSTEWDKGWIVTSLTQTPPAVLRVQKALTNANDSFIAKSGTTSVVFDRNGFAHSVPEMLQGVAVIELTTPANTLNQWTRCVDVAYGGQLTTGRYQQDTNCK